MKTKIMTTTNAASNFNFKVDGEGIKIIVRFFLLGSIFKKIIWHSRKAAQAVPWNNKDERCRKEL